MDKFYTHEVYNGGLVFYLDETINTVYNLKGWEISNNHTLKMLKDIGYTDIREVHLSLENE